MKMQKNDMTPLAIHVCGERKIENYKLNTLFLHQQTSFLFQNEKGQVRHQSLNDIFPKFFCEYCFTAIVFLVKASSIRALCKNNFTQ